MFAKRLLILVLFVGGVTALYPQSLRERIEQRRQSAAQQPPPGSTNTGTVQPGAAGTEAQNRYANESIENAKWSRIIYRHLDLNKEANAPLYYPVTPANGKMSLFTMLFTLLQEETIPAYEYLDGREEFTEEYRIKFREWLDRFGVYYETDNGKITVNDADIPGNEVQGYYVKEAWYFDTGSSAFTVRPLAICPVLHRSDDYNTATRYPLFWIPYCEISHYARRMPLMHSSLNNSMNGTIDDFFLMRKYDGEIYKAQNPRNLAISQYTTTPEEMKAEQERIEKELADFEKNLWKQEPYTAAPQQRGTTSRREKKKASSGTSAASVSMRDRRF